MTARALQLGGEVHAVFPSSKAIPADFPPKASALLEQALASIHAPAGSVMLAASAVDAMLKGKGYSEGSLYSRIDKAMEDHVITREMAQWAHAVRLDANDQRHADEDADLPTEDDAIRCIDFVRALGEFLFTLPARVARGIAKQGASKKTVGDKRAHREI